MGRILVLVLVVAAFCGALAVRFRSIWVEKKSLQAAHAVALRTAPLVEVARAHRGEVRHTVEAVGTVESQFTVGIASQVPGRIDFLQAREGDHVRRGEVLVRLDPREVQAQVRQQEAGAAEARHRLTQARLSQHSNDVALTARVREQQAAVRAAHAELRRARESSTEQLADANLAVNQAQDQVTSAESNVLTATAAVKSAEADLAKSRSDLERARSLYSRGFLAGAELEGARTAFIARKAALDEAKARVQGARAALDAARSGRQSAEAHVRLARANGEAAIVSAQAGVEQAEEALKDAEASTEQSAAFRENLAALQSSVDVARAGVSDARERQALTVLKSPIDGYVTERALHPGAMVTPGQSILTLQAVDRVWVTAGIPEEASRSIRVGQLATVRVDALGGRQLRGTVVQVNPASSAASHQFQVRVQVEKPDRSLRPGMFARVSLVTQAARSRTLVPREAVERSSTGATVLVVDRESVARRRTVTLGPTDGSNYIITRGLRPGDSVIVTAATRIRDGEKVRVSNDVGEL